jgi:DNA-binding NarL/FixJ family response regulator
MMEAGAFGFLTKQTTKDKFLKAIHEVHNGSRYLDDRISPLLGKLLKKHTTKVRQPHLTMREIEVLQLIAEGFGNRHIAAQLSISIHTVEKHRQRLINKIGISDVAGLTRYAIQHHIVESRPSVS